MLVSVDPGELGAKQQDEASICGPQQNQNDAPCGTVDRPRIPYIEVIAQPQLRQHKEKGCHQGSGKDIPPADLHIREKFEDRCKQQGDHGQRNDRVQVLDDGDQNTGKIAKPASKGSQKGCKYQRYQKQKADHENHPQGEEPVLQKLEKHLIGSRLHLPDVVEGLLNLIEHPCCPEQQRTQTDQGSQRQVSCLIGIGDDLLYRFSGSTADTLLELT